MTVSCVAELHVTESLNGVVTCTRPSHRGMHMGTFDVSGTHVVNVAWLDLTA